MALFQNPTAKVCRGPGPGPGHDVEMKEDEITGSSPVARVHHSAFPTVLTE